MGRPRARKYDRSTFEVETKLASDALEEILSGVLLSLMQKGPGDE